VENKEVGGILMEAFGWQAIHTDRKGGHGMRRVVIIIGDGVAGKCGGDIVATGGTGCGGTLEMMGGEQIRQGIVVGDGHRSGVPSLC
jgi:hypothetical protein